MGTMRTLLRTGLALCLACSLALGSTALAADREKSLRERRQEDLDYLCQTVLHHPDVFANTPEREFLALKEEICGRLDSESGVSFLLDLMRLTSLVGDSHTALSIGSASGDFRMYPFAVIRRGTAWYLAAVPREDGALLCREVTHLAGRPVEELVSAWETLFASDNRVHLRRQFQQSCNVADVYEYLGLVEAGAPLTVTLTEGGTLSLAPVSMDALGGLETVRIADRVQGRPATAETDAYYFAQPLTDSVYYIQYNVCQEAPDLSMEDFAAAVAEALDAGAYRRILLDLRNNGGGSDGAVWPLFQVLREAMDGGAELVGLIGEGTFSSALINAVEIQEMGGVLAGEAAGGSVCHFGAVRTFTLPNCQARGQISSKYIDLNTLLDAGAGRGVVELEPDVAVPQTLEDTLAGRDTAVEWLLAHPERLSQRAYPDAPLTRGRFVAQLYEAMGSPAVEPDKTPFADSFGIEWYLPALAWARREGVAGGAPDGTFSAARPITWGEAAVFLARTLGGTMAGRSAPLPETLSSGWTREAAQQVWDLGLFPAEADFTMTPTRAQGQAMAAACRTLLSAS